MKWREFFKPNTEKILFSFLLYIYSAIMLIVIIRLFLFMLLLLLFSPLVSFIFYGLYFGMLFFLNFLIYFSIAIFFVCYIFSCYIYRTGKWLKGIILHSTTLIIISFVIGSSIYWYNEAYGYSCTDDSNCEFICGAGAVNNKFIYLKDPFTYPECFGYKVGVCENGKCETLNLFSVTNVQECERVKTKQQYYADKCYFILAEKLNDTALCYKIEDVSIRERCIFNLAR